MVFLPHIYAQGDTKKRAGKMTNRDFNEICKLLQREQTDVANRLVDLQNTYEIFKRYDELDMLELLTLKIKQQHLNEFEQKLLALCDHLVRFGS